VSSIESPRSSAPVRRRNVRRPVARPTAAAEPNVAKAPDPAPENKVQIAEIEPSTEAPAPAIETPTNVAVTPRPTPVGSAPATTDAGTGGVGGGSRGGGLGGIGEAIGTVIGVVIIRGGAGGVDHCDPRTDRHPRNGPVAYPDIWARAGGGMAPNNPVPHRRGLPRWPTRLHKEERRERARQTRRALSRFLAGRPSTRWQYQPNLIAGLHGDLVAHRRSVASDGVGEKPEWCRPEDEIRGNGERGGGIARRVAEADALPASNRIYRHVRKSLILDSKGCTRLRIRRGMRFRTAASDKCEADHRNHEVAPCWHRLLRVVLRALRIVRDRKRR